MDAVAASLACRVRARWEATGASEERPMAKRKIFETAGPFELEIVPGQAPRRVIDTRYVVRGPGVHSWRFRALADASEALMWVYGAYQAGKEKTHA